MDFEYTPPRKGWTVTPDFDEATGEYLEPQVGYGHSPLSPFADGDEYSNEIELSPDAVEPHDVDDDIADAIHELYDIDSILDYVVNTYPEEFYADYDQAVDAGDWAKVHDFLERMNAEYQDTQPQEVQYNDEEVQEELNQLVETEPEGLEVAFELLQQAEQTDNPIESQMLQMASMFHKGDVTAEDAIQQMLGKYPVEELTRIYTKLNNQ